MQKIEKGPQPLGRIVSDPKNQIKPLTPVERRLIKNSAIISMDAADHISFLHSLFCQTTLPTRKYSEPVWGQQNGDASIRIEAGHAYNPEENIYIPLPLPYGPKARLVQIHLDTEAIRTQSPVIEVQDSMTAFFRTILGKNPSGREINDFKTQLGSWAASSIRIARGGDNPFQVQTHMISSFDLWFPKDAGQKILWPSVVTLSADYYQSLANHAVPLDPRAVAALSHTALGLDIYKWLAQRLCRVRPNYPSFVPWNNLWKQQFGMGYSRIRKFREKFLVALEQVHSQYPTAKIHADKRGLTLYHSPPPIAKKLITVKS